MTFADAALVAPEQISNPTAAATELSRARLEKLAADLLCAAAVADALPRHLEVHIVVVE